MPDATHPLAEAVRASGLSLKEIARRSGLSDGNIGRWLRGEITITLDSADKIAAALGLTLSLKRVKP